MKKTAAPSTTKRAVKTRHDINVVGNAADARPPFRGATDTELRDHMDSNKPVLFIPTEALGVVSEALKKWETQQMEAKQPAAFLPSKDVAGQVCGGLARPKPLLTSMIDRAHDRVSILRDKLQMLHERMSPVLRPCGPSPVNQCSAAEDLSNMPEAVQSIYSVGTRLNDVIDHVNDLLDRLEA